MFILLPNHANFNDIWEIWKFENFMLVIMSIRENVYLISKTPSLDLIWYMLYLF